MPPKQLRNNSFGPEHRLHQNWEYRRFFQGSEVLRLRTCAIFRIQNTGDSFRLGITVKARCNSVERNRVKRRIRESFRLLKMSLGSYDYNVVISDKRKLDFTYARQLFKELTEVFPSELHRFKATRPAV